LISACNLIYTSFVDLLWPDQYSRFGWLEFGVNKMVVVMGWQEFLTGNGKRRPCLAHKVLHLFPCIQWKNQYQRLI
jgi:hypothetical protein